MGFIVRVDNLWGMNGVAIVESGISFGGGAFMEYGIRSNTSANGFVKMICFGWDGT